MSREGEIRERIGTVTADSSAPAAAPARARGGEAGLQPSYYSLDCKSGISSSPPRKGIPPHLHHGRSQ